MRFLQGGLLLGDLLRRGHVETNKILAERRNPQNELRHLDSKKKLIINLKIKTVSKKNTGNSIKMKQLMLKSLFCPA